MALHGNWVGVDAAGRAMMAQALSSSFGRDKLPNGSLAELCTEEELDRAHHWGLAIRLGQRLSGGVGSVLQSTRLGLDPEILHLNVSEGERALVSDGVQRRLSRLAEAVGRTAEVVVG